MIAYINALPPDQKQRILAEIAKHVISSSRDSVSFDIPSLLGSPLLNSALSETLRMEFRGLSARGVSQQTSININNHVYTLEKDSMVFLAMSCVHKDPGIYTNPEKYQVHRYEEWWRGKLQGDDDSKSSFYKNGVPLKHPLMPWGGGYYMVHPTPPPTS